MLSRVARSVRKLPQKLSPSMNAALLIVINAIASHTSPGPTNKSPTVPSAHAAVE